MLKKKRDKDLIVGLDIGTSKIVTLVGQLTPENRVQVVGMGTHPSRGLKRGVVVNIEATVQSIQKSIEEAEKMAGCEIHSAFTGIAGSHINSLNSHGIVAIRESEVCQEDIDRVIDAAKAVAIPADQRILHILPQEFIIDNQEGINDPIGMAGVRLEAKVHMITGSVSASQNIVKCVQSCGLNVGDMILEQLASSYSVLNEDEKELGVCLVDIGAGTTDIAVFIRGAIRYTIAIPIAGDQVTNDIAIALRTPTVAAEGLKHTYGGAVSTQVNTSDVIQVAGVGDRPGRKLPRRMLVEVMQARYEELFELIKHELCRSGFYDLVAAGLVLTGGASKVAGLVDLAESVLDLPVRLGVPEDRVEGLDTSLQDPSFSTGIGLLLYGKRLRFDQSNDRMPLGSGVKSMWQRMMGWFQGNF